MKRVNSQNALILKQTSLLQIDGINYGKVIAIETYYVDLKSIITALVKCLFYDFKIQLPNDQILTKVFLYSLSSANRHDYNEIRDYFLSYFPEFQYAEVNRNKSLKDSIAKAAKILCNYISLKIHKVPSSFLTAILLTEYVALTKQLNKHISWDKIKIIGTFCDALCVDNLVTQIAANNGAKTFTLQHGQYRILKKDNENADAESYKNFISDRLLAWGEATKEEFIKYGIKKNRVVPVGALRKFSFNRKMESLINNKIFGVILSGDIYESSNIGMIKIANLIAKKLNMKYYLRLHPRNIVGKYIKYVDDEYLEKAITNIDNFEYANSVTFSLIHMTGVFVELLSINSPILIYNDQYMEDVFKLKGFTFSDEIDLLTMLGSYLDDLSELKRRQFEYYHHFNNYLNIKENYRNAIKNLEEEI